MITIKAHRRWEFDSFDVFILDTNDGLNYNFFNFDKDGLPSINRVTIKEGGIFPNTIKPAFQLNGNLYRDFVKAFLTLAQEEDIRIPEKSKVEGLYEAQSKHLLDLRKLLKLNY